MSGGGRFLPPYDSVRAAPCPGAEGQPAAWRRGRRAAPKAALPAGFPPPCRAGAGVSRLAGEAAAWPCSGLVMKRSLCRFAGGEVVGAGCGQSHPVRLGRQVSWAWSPEEVCRGASAKRVCFLTRGHNQSRCTGWVCTWMGTSLRVFLLCAWVLAPLVQVHLNCPSSAELTAVQWSSLGVACAARVCLT